MKNNLKLNLDFDNLFHMFQSEAPGAILIGDNPNYKVILAYDFIDGGNSPSISLTIQPIKPDQLPDMVICTDRFNLLEDLEDLLSKSYSEFTNSDACSFLYEFDTNHAGDPITYRVIIIDSLS